VKRKILIPVISLLMMVTILPAPIAAGAMPDFVTVDLIAGKSIDSGDVLAWNDARYIYVEYACQDGWTLAETHLSIEEYRRNTQTKSGNPVPGKFEYKEYHTAGTAEYTYVIPRDGRASGTQLFVAAHAAVERISEGTEQSESAWAEGIPFPGKNPASYFAYTVRNLPPVAVTDGPYFGNPGETVRFDGSGSYDPDGSIISYEWDFGDGNTADAMISQHSYSLPGEYTVTLSVTDDSGAADTASGSVRINSPPFADGTFSEAYVSDRYTPVLLHCDRSFDSDGYIALYEWDFDADGVFDWSSASPDIVERTYSEAGFHFAILRVTDNDGASATTSVSVKIVYLMDDFNDNVLNTSKWSPYVYANIYNPVPTTVNKYEEINQEARFSIFRNGGAFLISDIIHIENWNTVTIEGRWKFESPLSRPTPEMTLYLYDADTSQLNGVAYDNWNSKIRYWYSSSNKVEVNRTSPRISVRSNWWSLKPGWNTGKTASGYNRLLPAHLPVQRTSS
jgi:PKD repeat protein